MQTVPEQLAGLTENRVARVVTLLRRAMGKKRQRGESLPDVVPNATSDAVYQGDSLRDPGIIDGVTGNGRGPAL